MYYLCCWQWSWYGSLLPTAVLAADGELAGDGRADSPPTRSFGAADLMAFAEMVNGVNPVSAPS